MTMAPWQGPKPGASPVQGATIMPNHPKYFPPDQFPASTRTPEALAQSQPKESAMAELRRILHTEDECHPGLTCADEIMEQHTAMLDALKATLRAIDIVAMRSMTSKQSVIGHAVYQQIQKAIAKAEGK
ncbi:MAG: hypothetical protein HC888_03490 [Candidatus Competibacteraceae bacterium]|nr:hypothetical protein [Candidatus Competibacteraceae bacterium]